MRDPKPLKNEIGDDQAKSKGLRSAKVKATRQVTFSDILIRSSCVSAHVLLVMFIHIFTTAGLNLA